MRAGIAICIDLRAVATGDLPDASFALQTPGRGRTVRMRMRIVVRLLAKIDARNAMTQAPPCHVSCAVAASVIARSP